jgi:hypothetical protein
MAKARNRLVAFVAAVTLIACAAVYSAHDIAERAHGQTHCDLCVHFSGSAGSQAQAKPVTHSVPVVRTLLAPVPLNLPARPLLGLPLPRGPPPASLTV